MSIKIDFDFRPLNKAIRDLAEVRKKPVEKIMLDEMRLLTERLVELTPPAHGRGTGQEAKLLGEGAVRRDVSNVFFVGDNPKARQNLDPLTHENRRDRRGRVRFTRSIKRVSVKSSELNRYIREKIKHVGRAKAGWMKAVIDFKARSIPAWVKRHGTKDSDAVNRLKNGNGYLEAINRNKAIGSLNNQVRIVSAALIGRERDMRAKIQQILNKAAAKFTSAR